MNQGVVRQRKDGKKRHRAQTEYARCAAWAERTSERHQKEKKEHQPWNTGLSGDAQILIVSLARIVDHVLRGARRSEVGGAELPQAHADDRMLRYRAKAS